MQQSLTTGKPRAKLELVAEIMLLCPDKHHSSDVVYWRTGAKPQCANVSILMFHIVMHNICLFECFNAYK